MSATVIGIEPILDGIQGRVMIKVRDGAYMGQTAIDLADPEYMTKVAAFVAFVAEMGKRYQALVEVFMPKLRSSLRSMQAVPNASFTVVREDPTGYSGASEPQVYSEDALIDPDTF